MSKTNFFHSEHILNKIEQWNLKWEENLYRIELEFNATMIKYLKHKLNFAKLIPNRHIFIEQLQDEKKSLQVEKELLQTNRSKYLTRNPHIDTQLCNFHLEREKLLSSFEETIICSGSREEIELTPVPRSCSEDIKEMILDTLETIEMNREYIKVLETFVEKFEQRTEKWAEKVLSILNEHIARLTSWILTDELFLSHGYYLDEDTKGSCKNNFTIYRPDWVHI